MIELTDDQKKAVAAAQETFSNLKNNTDSLNETQLNLLFGEARSMNGWQDKDVSDELIRSIYELTKVRNKNLNLKNLFYLIILIKLCLLLLLRL
jgi:3-hydroxypropanoate dehydrogenase